MARTLTTAEKADLSKAIGKSRKTLRVFRENRLKLMHEAVGKHYSENGAIDKVPINFIELALNIYLQRLVAQNPKVSITTFYPQLKEIVKRFGLAGNNLIEDIELGDSLETVVINAMYSKGIIKIGLNRSTVEVGGITHDSGQPFADSISLDDWFEDMTVSENENAQFEGNYWYATQDELREMFPGIKDDEYNYEVDNTEHEEKDHDISEGNSSISMREEFKPVVRMVDVFLKKQNLIVQATYSGDEDDPIGEIKKTFVWKGPENGPYRKLGFAKVPGNTMPSAPAQHWYDIHALENNLMRKLGRQAIREKTVTGIAPGGEDDGNRVLTANDGEMINLRDPKNVADLHSGGINPQSLAFVLAMKDMFSYFAGNIDNLGGLGPQSETLGQDQLLTASASMRIQKMQKEVTNFTTKVLQDLMWYLWYDPNPNQKEVVKTAPGFPDIAISVPFNPEDREGDFIQYNIKLEPYSMQHHSPETKMQGIRTILMEIVPALRPDMDRDGVSIDTHELFKTISKLSNIPELDDIIKYSTPELEQPVGSSDKVRQAPATTRTNIRKNVSAPTDRGKSAVMQQALAGGNPQQSQIAQLSA